MRCPFCENPKTRVVDSRELNEGYTVRRRRICQDCGTRFTTYESLKIHKMKVLKRNKKYEAFEKEKIVGSIKRACIKLPINSEEIEEIIREVESRIWRNSSREISSTEIGEIILNHLKKVHPLAFLRFASVFFEYKSLDDLIKNTLDLKRELTELGEELPRDVSDEQTAKQVITEELIEDLSRKFMESDEKSYVEVLSKLDKVEEEAEPVKEEKAEAEVVKKSDKKPEKEHKHKPTLFD